MTDYILVGRKSPLMMCYGIESKVRDSYISNLDESALLITYLSDFNKDECFDPRGDIDEINAFLDIDISTDICGRFVSFVHATKEFK
ncbi:hypothetical protein Tco_1218683 [Tanacetum coccineum]